MKQEKAQLGTEQSRQCDCKSYGLGSTEHEETLAVCKSLRISLDIRDDSFKPHSTPDYRRYEAFDTNFTGRARRLLGAYPCGCDILGCLNFNLILPGAGASGGGCCCDCCVGAGGGGGGGVCVLCRAGVGELLILPVFCFLVGGGCDEA